MGKLIASGRRHPFTAGNYSRSVGSAWTAGWCSRAKSSMTAPSVRVSDVGLVKTPLALTNSPIDRHLRSALFALVPVGRVRH
jgi:hypothetical protein